MSTDTTTVEVKTSVATPSGICRHALQCLQKDCVALMSHVDISFAAVLGFAGGLSSKLGSGSIPSSVKGSKRQDLAATQWDKCMQRQ